MRRAALLLLGLVLLTSTMSTARAQTNGLDEARRSVEATRARLDEAQARANQAAAEYQEARGQEFALEERIAELQARVASSESALDEIRHEVADLAVEQYIENGQRPSIFDVEDVLTHERAEALRRLLTQRSADTVDVYRLAKAQLEDDEAELEVLLGEQALLVTRLETSREGVFAELEQIEAELDALEAQLAQLEEEERRRLEEEARRQAEAEAQRRAEEQARLQAEEQARQQELANQPAQPAPSQPQSDDAAPEPTTDPTAAPTQEPAPAPAPVAGWVCPVAGPHAFSNDWGAPRAYGGWHKGNDLLAAEGTPVVAVVSGTVEHRGNSVGGLSAHLYGSDGNYYYYTHLSGYANEGVGSVAAGTVIGYVGMTGNAGVPHLHFEMHVGGRGNHTNPYPTLVNAC